MMASIDRPIQEILKKAVQFAGEAGADHAVAVGETVLTHSIRFAKNQVTQHSEYETCTIKLTVAKNKRESIIETNKMEMEYIKALAQQAVRSAEFAPVNAEFVPPIPPQKYSRTQIWSEKTSQVSLNERALAVKDLCNYAESNTVELFGNLNHTLGRLTVFNSRGLSADQKYSEVTLRATARTMSGNGSSRVSAQEKEWGDLNFLALSRQAVESAKRSCNPRVISPGHYTVILGPEAVLEYVMYLIIAMDARNASMGQSYFSGTDDGSTRLNEKLFDERVTIQSLFDHPGLPNFYFGTAFGSGGSSAGMLFSFGLPMRNQTWIDGGILTSLRYSPYWAVKNKIEPVAYPFNIIMQGSDKSYEELIRETEHGLLINSLWYTNATDMNTIEITGLTRDGVYLIENGNIVSPVTNFRFNDSPVKSLNNILDISRSEKVCGEHIPGILPYIKVKNFNLSHVSEAV